MCAVYDSCRWPAHTRVRSKQMSRRVKQLMEDAVQQHNTMMQIYTWQTFAAIEYCVAAVGQYRSLIMTYVVARAHSRVTQGLGTCLVLEVLVGSYCRQQLRLESLPNSASSSSLHGGRLH